MLEVMQNSFVKSALLIVPFVLLAASTPAEAAVNTETEIREYFEDIPVMIEIARCESKFRQFTDSGNVLKGGAGGGMIGVFQFYESAHTGAASALGYDLTTLDGNLAYARHIYEAQGTTPWNSAKYCWENNISAATTFTKPNETALRQQIAVLTKLIKLLKAQIEAKKIA